MISHKHKFLSLRIPKTGSTSVTTILKPYFDIESQGIGASEENTYYHHRKTKYMKSHFEKMKWNFDDYFKFAFVRNPFEREVSLWKYLIRIKKEGETVEEKFSDFVKIPANRSGGRPGAGYTYMDYVKDVDGTIILDFIGRFENLQQDFNTVCDKIGIPHQELPHMNKTKHKHYTEYYDDETRQIVAEKYAKDIEYFGYEFGE